MLRCIQAQAFTQKDEVERAVHARLLALARQRLG